MTHPQTPQPATRLEDCLVDDPERCPGDPGFLRGLPLTCAGQGAARDLGEVQVRPQYPQRGPPPLPVPRCRFDPVPQCGEDFVRVVPGAHLITDATGIPLAVTLTGGNRNDVTQLVPLLEAVPPVRGKRGRPGRRPGIVLGDRGYNHDKYRRLVRALGVKPVIARRGTDHGSGLGTQRWVVERAFAHLHWFRRLRIRWEIRDDIHEAFLTLGCALICWRRFVSLP